MATIDASTFMPSDGVIRADLFGSTPPPPESTAVPETPDIMAIMADLRAEFEAKYSKDIQDLKDLVTNLLGGPPNLNAATKSERTEDMLKPIDFKDIKKPEEFDGTKDFHSWFDRFKDLLINRNRDWKVVFEKIEAAANESEKSFMMILPSRSGNNWEKEVHPNHGIWETNTHTNFVVI